MFEMRTLLLAALTLGPLSAATPGQDAIADLRAAAVAWEGELPCPTWDCECAFKKQRGCCCAALELREMEDEILQRVVNMSTALYQLEKSVLDVIGGMRVAFTAYLSPGSACLGPFTRNKTVPYDVITLNHGNGYNAALGIFTAPRSGVYSFAYSVYSKLERPGDRMYYKVQLMRNGEVVASTWEDNREDSEDSSSHVVLLWLQQGGQVYVQLLDSRQLCGNELGLNSFSGSLLHPALDQR